METYFRVGASLLRNIISPQKQNLFRPNDGASHRGKALHETKAAVRKTNGSMQSCVQEHHQLCGMKKTVLKGFRSKSEQ